MNQRTGDYSLPVRISHVTVLILLIAAGFTGLRLAWFHDDRFSLRMEEIIDIFTPRGITYDIHVLLGILFYGTGLFYVISLLITGEAARIFGYFRDRRYSFTKKFIYTLTFIIGVVSLISGVSIHSGLYLGAGGYLFNSFLHRWCFQLLVLFVIGHLIEVVVSPRVRINDIFLKKLDTNILQFRTFIIAAIVAAGTAWAVSLVTFMPAALECHELNRFALVDGREFDIEWVGADSAVVQTFGGANFHAGTATVTVKTFHNQRQIFFLVRWADPTLSFNRYLIKTMRGWREEKSEYPDLFGESIYSEDRLSLSFRNNENGCASTCHIRTEDKMGLHYTEGDTADVWEWQAVSTNPALEADDRWWAGYENDLIGGRHFDNKASGGYESNFNEEWQEPFFLPTHFSLRYWIWYGSSGYQPYHADADTFHIADRIPAVLVAPTTGDRGDVKARGNWRNGTWTVELSRKLSTGSSFDLPLREELYLSVAVFDNTDSKHTYHLKPIRLVVE